VWSDLARLLLKLQAAPPAQLSAPSCSAGSGASLASSCLRPRLEVLEGVDEAVAAFVRLRDADGIHSCALLAYNTGAFASARGRHDEHCAGGRCA
jgi:hypothetical protein